MIRITSDVECGNGKEIERLAVDRFRLQVDGDKQSGYCGYFCFDIINEGPQADVTIELWEDAKFGGLTGFHSLFPTTVWFKPVDFHRYRPLPSAPPRCEKDHAIFTVPVEQDQHVRVAMTYVAPYSEIAESLRHLTAERGDRCALFSVGTTVQGREILGLRAGTPGKPKLFCVAGQHPHEHAGVWGVLGIADFMSSLLPEAAALRDQLDVFVVPTVNPDGNVLGRNAFNAEGFDMYQAFGDNPDADLPEAHESRLLWEWVTSELPTLWMNFHCYTGWRLNSEFPYDGWYEVEDYGLFSDPAQRRLYAALCDTLRLETDAPSTHERASIHQPNTLCYQFAKRFDLPHAFYEINNGTAGKHLGTQRALHVFKRVTNTLLHYVQYDE
ncbi:MAG: M14 family zinc carboxypeptidase [Chloroflexota bacterium]|nr:M14 family zinc carboxypeptidase [Chloroflexota bacterium]MDE2931179.1 M14 family zinc carboxypeptidase [Chloroflexota bacterium]